MKRIAICGSTGSVGTSTLAVISSFPEDFEVVALAAGGNVELLARQIKEFSPGLVSLREERGRHRLLAYLEAEGIDAPAIQCGAAGAVAVAACPEAELVVNAIVGAAGLGPTLAAVRRGITVAIANKETLVIAGHLIMEEARASGAILIPVDSEHSAIFQCLQGRGAEEIHRVLLTGSGGPFRTLSYLRDVTPDQALAHPNWSMGPKITIDSATLMNKGLEMIEARWLFDLPPEKIQILIHPESIIHSMVELIDGAVIALLALPDIRGPIAYALGYPSRLPLELPRLDLARVGRLNFEAPDHQRFPCLELAYRALSQGGTAPAVLSAANEVAVAAFLARRIGFSEIPRLIERALEAHPRDDGLDEQSITLADSWARDFIESVLNQGCIF